MVRGLSGSRGARLCGVRRRRPVAGLMARRLPPSATALSRWSWGRRLAEGLETHRQG